MKTFRINIRQDDSINDYNIFIDGVKVKHSKGNQKEFVIKLEEGAHTLEVKKRFLLDYKFWPLIIIFIWIANFLTGVQDNDVDLNIKYDFYFKANFNATVDKSIFLFLRLTDKVTSGEAFIISDSDEFVVIANEIIKVTKKSVRYDIYKAVRYIITSLVILGVIAGFTYGIIKRMT